MRRASTRRLRSRSTRRPTAPSASPLWRRPWAPPQGRRTAGGVPRTRQCEQAVVLVGVRQQLRGRQWGVSGRRCGGGGDLSGSELMIQCSHESYQIPTLDSATESGITVHILFCFFLQLRAALRSANQTPTLFIAPPSPISAPRRNTCRTRRASRVVRQGWYFLPI